MAESKAIEVFLPDQAGVSVSRYGYGNHKLGPGVFTYSRPAGRSTLINVTGTCPGSTAECEDICYAKRIVGDLKTHVYWRNAVDNVPPIPAPCKVLRIHVSGDFDSVRYVEAWTARLRERPDVTAWAYTRSWRVPTLLPALEELRSLVNLQLFASVDPSMAELPPAGWRWAWIWRDQPNGQWPTENRLKKVMRILIRGSGVAHNPARFTKHFVGPDGRRAWICPEETGDKHNCVNCGYCFEGNRHDVVFLEHDGTSKHRKLFTED